ncbi:hypothetical protein [Massilia sp. 9096]|uniref:hypothetical protein n=1 Tax=Massilia sp. 9096 TaxID=1500894 RepID=UPI00055B4DAA|nr:hypothetical protein [Massilia sp. 9096]
MNAALRPPSDRRLAALAFTALVHVLMLLGWQMTRRLPAPIQADPPGIQWIDLCPRAPALPRPAPAHVSAPAPAREAANPQSIHVLPAPVAVEPAPPNAAPYAAGADPAPAAGAHGGVAGGALLQGALRAAGSVDKALRKENYAYIVAPPDSAQMRMRRGMEAAHAMLPPKLWEAPKIEELVNNTGDGTRHTRVITGNGTYCINERSTHVSIDTIETLGKVSPHLTCPEHETPAGSQEWKTARD